MDAAARLGDTQVEEKLARLVVELKRRGYRVTAQRLAIAKIVFENIKDHPSFMEILEAVRQRMPSISPSTIYNNLQLLEQMGFIKSFDVAGETRYDDNHLHINLVCLDKGKIVDIDDFDVVERLAQLVEEKYGASMHEVVIYARCGAGTAPPLEDSNEAEKRQPLASAPSRG